MKVTVLGCGGSGGVPVIGNIWGECDPHNPKNRRRRVSILVQDGDTNILVDCGPDLRDQLNSVGVSRIDAVLITHVHADHTHGIDDLRRLFWVNNDTPLQLYARDKDFADLEARFPYAFQPFHYGFKPEPPLHKNIMTGPFKVGSIEITPFEQDHGRNTSTGFRFGDFAYSTDVRTMSDENFATLAGTKYWLVDCLREEPDHPAHSWFSQTLGWIERLKPDRAWLTHMDRGLDYAKTLAKCPKGVEPAYDGLEIII